MPRAGYTKYKYYMLCSVFKRPITVTDVNYTTIQYVSSFLFIFSVQIFLIQYQNISECLIILSKLLLKCMQLNIHMKCKGIKNLHFVFSSIFDLVFLYVQIHFLRRVLGFDCLEL